MLVKRGQFLTCVFETFVFKTCLSGKKCVVSERSIFKMCFRGQFLKHVLEVKECCFRDVRF